MQRPQRWPKGAFPEKYRWDAVEARLASAWDEPERHAALELLAARGFVPFAGHVDPYVRVFEREGHAAIELASLRETLSAHAVFVFEWLPPEREDTRPRVAVIGSVDPLAAVVAVGVAGPAQGIGTAAVVRFVIALRALSRMTIDALGEDRMRLSIEPRDEETALVIARRVLQLCPSIGRAGATPETLAARMSSERVLELDWA